MQTIVPIQLIRCLRLWIFALNWKTSKRLKEWEGGYKKHRAAFLYQINRLQLQGSFLSFTLIFLFFFSLFEKTFCFTRCQNTVLHFDFTPSTSFKLANLGFCHIGNICWGCNLRGQPKKANMFEMLRPKRAYYLDNKPSAYIDQNIAIHQI